ncbi:VCBS domain-containing protein [Bradyrhizobium canariense]|uniref:VCBS domain-containing protein n=1 Tax=Bradyrhizobium canariense TaxID=255045 RepID=UPI001CA50017|nr:VCBS domain-containing protein [Bradyrhizobium canariense]
MATQATGGGSTVSFGNTPQANTDIFSFAEDASNILILNVLANDLGGAAKTLFSLDDGTSSSASTKNYAPADLLVKDVAYSSDAAGMAATGDRSALGARIWIEADGTVHYDKGDINVQLQALATGQTLTDTFTYAIQLGNGTLSWATVTLQFNGQTTRSSSHRVRRAARWSKTRMPHPVSRIRRARPALSVSTTPISATRIRPRSQQLLLTPLHSALSRSTL